MHASLAVFHHACEQVHPSDVEEFAPNDPGYLSYVRGLNAILADRRLPEKADPGVSEAISLTRWGDRNSERAPDAFRRFRVFTNSIALCLTIRDGDPCDDRAPNYTAIGLIDDAVATADEPLLALLPETIDELRAALIAQHETDELPYLSFAQLLLAANRDANLAEQSTLANRVIQDDDHLSDRITSSFVFGCSHFDQLASLWRHHTARLLSTDDSTVRLVRDAVLDES
ncbi:MAG: hypothetical protein AAGI46_03185 [Planctomycetota bacterium]